MKKKILLTVCALTILTTINCFGQQLTSEQKAEREKAKQDSIGAVEAANAAYHAAMAEERAEKERAKQDSIAAVEAANAAYAAAKADSTDNYESSYLNKPFYGTYKYRNSNSFTSYIARVKAPKNSFSDFSFTLAVENPEGSYTIEGFAIQKEETLDLYYLKTTKGKFPLAASINKKTPLFSLKKINDNLITIWGQIKENENIKILFEHSN